MKGFVDCVLEIDPNASFPEVHDNLVALSARYGLTEILSSLNPLLIRLRLREAFVLSMLLNRSGMSDRSVYFSLCIGGVLFGSPEEEKRGMDALQNKVDGVLQPYVYSESDAIYYRVVVAPIITHILKQVLDASDHTRIVRLMNILQAVTPQFREPDVAPVKTPSFLELTQTVVPLKLVDVGVALMGSPPYVQLLKDGAELVGFDPGPSALDLLHARKGPHETYLPYAIGDGKRHVLYLHRGSGFNSLLQINPKMFKLFHGFAMWGEVIGTLDVDTVRLDDVAEAVGADLFKMDIQGSELMVLRNAEERLRDFLVVHIEVEFLPLYIDQPLFSDIDQFLRSHGFILHRFSPLLSLAIHPMRKDHKISARFSQVSWGDAVFVRDFTQLERLTDRQLLVMAKIVHDCYASFDLALYLLTEYDQRTGSQLGTRYLAGLNPSYWPEGWSPPPQN